MDAINTTIKKVVREMDTPQGRADKKMAFEIVNRVTDYSLEGLDKIQDLQVREIIYTLTGNVCFLADQAIKKIEEL